MFLLWMKFSIFSVVKSMHPIKVLGPDRMLAIFYQKYWDVVGLNVLNLVQHSSRWESYLFNLKILSSL